MSQSWHSLYLPTENAEAVADALGETLTGLNYQLYDPFPGGKGPRIFRWTKMVRHFVAPLTDGWVRVIGQPDSEMLPEFAKKLNVAVVQAWLTGDEFGLVVWSADGEQDVPGAFAPWLRDGKTPADLAAALAGKIAPPALEEAESASLMGVPLPDNINPKRAEKMTRRFSKRLFKRIGGAEMQSQAQELVESGGESPWQTPGGDRLRAEMACLTVPDNWRVPIYDDLREAYQVARAQRRNPDRPLLPGDDEVLAAVPDALNYTPVFAGIR